MSDVPRNLRRWTSETSGSCVLTDRAIDCAQAANLIESQAAELAALRQERDGLRERLEAALGLIRRKLYEGHCGIEWGEKAEAILMNGYDK